MVAILEAAGRARNLLEGLGPSKDRLLCRVLSWCGCTVEGTVKGGRITVLPGDASSVGRTRTSGCADVVRPAEWYEAVGTLAFGKEERCR